MDLRETLIALTRTIRITRTRTDGMRITLRHGPIRAKITIAPQKENAKEWPNKKGRSSSTRRRSTTSSKTSRKGGRTRS